MSHVDDGTLHAYLDGELSAMEAVRLEKHTTECPACRDRLGEARTLVRRASQLLDAATPPVRAAPPLDDLREPRLGWHVRIPLAWAATVILALGAGWYFGIRGGESGAGKQTAATPPTHTDTAKPIVVATRTGPAAAGAQPQTQPQLKVDTQAQAQGGEAQNENRALAAREQPVESTARAPTLQPRASSPEPPPPGVTARVAVGRALGDQVASAWAPVSADSARALLGVEPVAIPNVPVRGIRASALGDQVVLVEQPLDSATVVYLYERPSAYMGRQRSELLARYVGALRVEIAAQLPADSLSKLLDSLKPMR